MKILRIIKKIIGYFPKKIEIIKRRRNLFNIVNNKNDAYTKTIIASNCVGGCIYHDLGLKFLSPTINLYFDENDFLKFICNLEKYISFPVIPVYDLAYKFPVGSLGTGEDKINIFFQHYKSIDEAIKKWEERKKRINWNNLVVVWEIPHEPDVNIINQAIKAQKNIFFITKNDRLKSSRIMDPKIYDNNYHCGKSLDYKSVFSGKRYLDRCNYIYNLFGDNNE